MENKSTKSMTKQELQKYIIAEATKMLNAGDAMDVDMNAMDKEVGSDGALVAVKEKGGFEKKTAAPDKAENIVDTTEPLEVKMNQEANEGGSDEKVATAVSVDAASSTKKGDSVEGMHNANFESKDKNPSTEASTPFEEKVGDVKMGKMDKATDTGAATYVEAGAKDATGQAKANFSETAKNEKEKNEAIAKAIQLPESFKNKKDLLNFINEEAKKLSKLI